MALVPSNIYIVANSAFSANKFKNSKKIQCKSQKLILHCYFYSESQGINQKIQRACSRHYGRSRSFHYKGDYPLPRSLTFSNEHCHVVGNVYLFTRSSYIAVHYFIAIVNFFFFQKKVCNQVFVNSAFRRSFEGVVYDCTFTGAYFAMSLR